MWKKDEGSPAQPTAQQGTPRAPTTRQTSSSASGRATIGPSISIKGDVTGSEDLLIQGRVDGSITLDNYAVSVGNDGRVTANITGRVITIEGNVEGDLTAEEQIVLRGSAQVHGDIKAPRVVLEDGATFRGLVDMGAPKAKAPQAGAPAASTKSTGGSSSGDASSGSSASAGSSSGAADTSSSSSSSSASSGRSKDKEKETTGASSRSGS